MSDLRSLRPERLMEHMKALCEGIGARPPCSERERQAASYVRDQLIRLGITEIQEQKFKSHLAIGQNISALIAGGIGGGFLALFGSRVAKFLGGTITILAALGVRGLETSKPHPITPFLEQGKSQNVIARITPTGEIKRRLYLVGHLDTNQQLYMLPFNPQRISRPFYTLSIAASLAAGASMCLSAFRKEPKLPAWAKLVWASLIPTFAAIKRDQSQPHIEGANDNATAVSVLLGIAEALREHPLEDTEVILLFTGCEEVGCVGIQAYLKAFEPPKFGSYFIDLEMVGTGNICYVTQHGMSHWSQYRPSEIMAAAAARAAVKHPGLNIAGRDMLITEEVAPLVREGYHALCIAGYDQEGHLPNWHRLTDKLDRIESGTLSRAARYTWAVMQEIAHLP